MLCMLILVVEEFVLLIEVKVYLVVIYDVDDVLIGVFINVVWELVEWIMGYVLVVVIYEWMLVGDGCIFLFIELVVLVSEVGVYLVMFIIMLGLLLGLLWVVVLLLFGDFYVNCEVSIIGMIYVENLIVDCFMFLYCWVLL